MKKPLFLSILILFFCSVVMAQNYRGARKEYYDHAKQRYVVCYMAANNIDCLPESQAECNCDTATPSYQHKQKHSRQQVHHQYNRQRKSDHYDDRDDYDRRKKHRRDRDNDTYEETETHNYRRTEYGLGSRTWYGNSGPYISHTTEKYDVRLRMKGKRPEYTIDRRYGGGYTPGRNGYYYP